ncbi:MAG: HIT family protein [Patescibacteria group bacterium]
MNDCLFCKISSGEISCHKVFEDEFVLAFLDIHPCSKGHTVVIPKQHAVEMKDMKHKVWLTLMNGVKLTAELVDKKLKPAGLNIGINNRPAAGQAVGHVHWHIIPRYENDGGGSMHSIIRSANPGDVEKIAKLFQ